MKPFDRSLLGADLPAWRCHSCGGEIVGDSGLVLIARRDPASGAVGGRPNPRDVCANETARPYHIVAVHAADRCVPRRMVTGVRIPLTTPVTVECWMASVAEVSGEPWATALLCSDLLRFWWTGRLERLPIPTPALLAYAHHEAA